MCCTVFPHYIMLHQSQPCCFVDIFTAHCVLRPDWLQVIVNHSLPRGVSCTVQNAFWLPNLYKYWSLALWFWATACTVLLFFPQQMATMPKHSDISHFLTFSLIISPRCRCHQWSNLLLTSGIPTGASEIRLISAGRIGLPCGLCQHSSSPFLAPAESHACFHFGVDFSVTQ